MRSHEPFCAPIPSTSPRRVGTGAFDAHRSPLGSHPLAFGRSVSSEEPQELPPVCRRPPWTHGRRAQAARLRAPRSSSSSHQEVASAPPWKRLTTSDRQVGLRRTSPRSCRPAPALRGAPASRRRETASRFRRDRCRLPAPRDTPRGVTCHQRAPPCPSGALLQTLLDPELVRRPPGVSRRLRAPKSASSPREPASKPQDPAAATHHAPSPRRTMKRRRHVRRDPAGQQMSFEIA